MKKLYSLFSSILILSAASALHAQTISVDKTSLSFSGQAGGSATSQTLTVNGTGSPQFFVASNAAWLKVNNQDSAGPLTAPATLTISANPGSLTAQNYSGIITILPVSGATITVPVTFAVGSVGVSPTSISYAYQANGTIPNATTVTLNSASTISYSAAAATTTGGSWLVLSGTSGNSPGTLTVSLNAGVVASLAPGSYTGSVTITPSGSAAITIPVTLTVTSAPTVTANTSSVNLNYQVGGASGATNSASAVVTLTNPGVQDLPFAVATIPNGAWLSATPSGSVIPANGTATVTVSYLTAQNLAANSYSGQVTVFVPNAANQQLSIPVTLRVSNSPLLNLPGATLAYTYQVGGPAPASKSVTATSSAVAADAASGQMALLLTKSENSNWLSIPSSGTTGTATPIVVSVSPAGLAVGNYTATISVIGGGAANNPQTIPVTLTVSNDPLVVATFGGCSSLNATCPLNFAIQSGQTATTTQNVKVTSSTGAQASFAATATMTTPACGNGWLSTGVTAAVIGNEATFPIAVTPGSIPVPMTCEGTITITGTNPTTGAALPNSPVTIPVKMYLSANAMMVASPIALNFSLGTNATASQTFTVTSTSSTNFDFNALASSGAQWLLAFPLARNTTAGSNAVTVAVNTSGLNPGTYSATVVLTAASVQNSPLIVPVTLTITSATMTVAPTSLSFQQALGSNAPAPKTVTVSTSSTDIPFTTAVATSQGSGWLSATPSTGTATSATPATVSIAVNGSNLPAGTYQGTVTITGANANGSPSVVNVTFEVLAGTISATPASLSFDQVAGGTAPVTKTIAVNGTPGALSYSVAVATDNNSGNWLTATPASGTTNSTVTVSVNAGSLAPGQYTGKVTITSTGASGSPVTVPVALNVIPAQSLTVAPATLNFSYVIGTAAPQAQTAAVTTGPGVAFTAAATTSAGGNWLMVTPVNGTGSNQLTIGINTSAITAAGEYTGTVAISSPSAATNPAATVTVKLTVTAIPKPVITAVANAASYVAGAVSPGENIVIFGTGIGPATITSPTISGNAFPTTVANTQVFFDNIPAPILYVSGNQTSVMVPYGIAGRTTTSLRIVYSGVQSDAISYNVLAAAPGIYTANSAGNGQGAILNQDYSVNTSSRPAAKDSVVAIYLTGEGVTSPASIDGRVAPVDGTGLYKPVLPVTATIGGQTAVVEYYGSAPGILYGVMQVNVRIPANAASGNQPIVINVGGNSTQSNVTVAVAAQ